jgi:hypothetical protein
LGVQQKEKEMKRLTLACCLSLLVASTLWARPYFIVFEEGHEQFSPDKFGYKIERKNVGDSVHLTVTMSPDAARALRRARLWLYSGDALVLDTDLAARALENGKKQLVLTVARTYLNKSQIVLYSDGYNNALAMPNFAGFKVMLEEHKTAERKDADDKQ